MGRKKRETMEFRFYEVPQGNSCLALLGEKWIIKYGENDIHLHFHNLFEIGYCRHGDGTIIFDEKKCKYSSKMLTVVPTNYPHATFSEQENFWEYIFFDPDSIVAEMYPGNTVKQREVLSIINKRADIFDEEDYPEITETVKRIMEEMRAKNPLYLETTKYLMRVFILQLIRIQESKIEELPSSMEQQVEMDLTQVAPALNFIDANFGLQIKVRELAIMCSMSETHFRRIFEKSVNMPPMEYLNLVRVQKACEMLKKTNFSMDQVASECGFATTSTFNRNFKKFLNVSPYQWKLSKDNYANRLLNYNIQALKGW